MGTGASQIFVENVREADAIINAQSSSGASRIFVEQYTSAIAILRGEADPGQASEIFVERVRQAALILGIDISGFPPQLNSFAWNGIDEVMANTTPQALEIANLWTMLVVFKPTLEFTSTVVEFASQLTGDNLSSIALQTRFTSQEIQIVITDEIITPSVGATKNWAWNGQYQANVWTAAVVRWNGATETISLAVNGVALGDPDLKSADAAVTMGNTPRMCFLGGSRAGASIRQGKGLTIALWDTLLSDAEIAEIYNDGEAGAFDLSVDSGAYVSSASNKHLWRFCNSGGAERGLDEGKAALLIDFDADSTNVDDTNCVPDVPVDVAIPQTQSCDFDGNTEALRTQTVGTLLGVANTWTVGLWVNGRAPTGTDVLFSTLLAAGGDQDKIIVARDETDDRLSLDIETHQLLWNNYFVDDVWVYVVVVWDGSEVFAYKNGVDFGDPDSGLKSPSIGMGDSNPRFIGVGASAEAPSSIAWNGLLSQCQLWRVALTSAEILELYASGNPNSQNLNSNFGNYVSAADLARWWRPGVDPQSMWRDFAAQGFALPVSLFFDVVDIDENDAVSDVPA